MGTISDDLYAGLIEDTKKEVEERDAERSGSSWSYLDEGTYHVRLYSEVYNGRLRLMRRVWIHRYDDLGTFICEESLGRDKCRMCEQFERAKKSVPRKTKGLWRFSAQEVGIIRTHIHEFSETSEYIKIGEPTHLILGRWAAIDGFQRWLTELKPHDLRELLDGENAHLIKIHYFTEDDRQKCVLSISEKRGVAAPLPEDFPSMDEVFITDRIPNDIEMRTIVNQIGNFIHEKTRGLDVSDPGDTSHQEPPRNRAAAALGADPEPQRTTTKDEPSSTTKSEPETASEQKCPSTDPELGFGKRPKSSHPDCATCSLESACIRATMINKKKAANG